MEQAVLHTVVLVELVVPEETDLLFLDGWKDIKMKYAWIENQRIRDIAPGNPVEFYHSDVAVFYDTQVPNDAANGDRADRRHRDRCLLLVLRGIAVAQRAQESRARVSRPPGFDGAAGLHAR